MNLSPDSSERLEKLERVTELPLMLASFVLIPVLAGLYIWDLSAVEHVIYTVLEVLIWAFFAVVFLLKLAFAPRKLRYLKSNWAEALIVFVPILRPLRIAAVILFVVRDFTRWKRLVTFETLAAYGLGIVLLAATVVTTVERNADEANILTFPDALYWSLITVSTVGYGDHYPVTAIGKLTAVALIFFGIGIFAGIVTTIVATFDRSN